MKKPAQFKVGKYTVVPRNSIFGVFLIKLFTPPVKHWLGTFLVLMIVSSLFWTTALTSADIFFVVFIFVTFFWNIEGRYSIGFSLLCLVLIMTLLLINQFTSLESTETWSEIIAVWTYYFLVIGIVKQSWDLFREPKEEIVPATLHGHTVIVPHPKGIRTNPKAVNSSKHSLTVTKVPHDHRIK